jgi:hypothetical protein
VRTRKPLRTRNIHVMLLLSDDEKRVLDELCNEKGMTQAGVMRQALRLYQLVDRRDKDGERLFFEGDKQRRTEVKLVF